MSQWSHSVVTQQHHRDFTLWHHCDMYVISYRWESHCDYHVRLTVWVSQCDSNNGSQLIWHEYLLLYHTRLTLWELHSETHVTVMWCSQCDSHSMSLVWYHSKYGMMSCVDWDTTLVKYIYLQIRTCRPLPVFLGPSNLCRLHLWLSAICPGNLTFAWIWREGLFSGGIKVENISHEN